MGNPERKIKMEFELSEADWQSFAEYLKTTTATEPDSVDRFRRQLTFGLLQNYALPVDMDPPLS